MIRNIISLLALQLGTYLAPLLTVPILTRALGPEGYGSLGVAYIIAGYGLLFAEWGFGHVASRQIAQSGQDRQAISNVFWHTLMARLVMCLVATCAIVLAGALTQDLLPDPRILWSAWTLVIGGALNCVWALQGLEKLQRYAYVALALRLTSVPATLLLVRSPDDVWVAALIQGAISILVAVSSIHALGKTRAVTWVQPRLHLLLSQLRMGFSLLIMNFANALILNSGTIFVSVLAGPAPTGMYYSAERVRVAAQGLIGPIGQAVYPRMAKLSSENHESWRRLFWRVFWLQTAMMLAVGISISVLAEPIVSLVAGDGYAEAVGILRILAFVPVFASVSNTLCMHVIIAGGRFSAAMRIYVAAALACLLGTPLLISLWGVNGAAAMSLATELLIVVLGTLVVRGEPQLRRTY